LLAPRLFHLRSASTPANSLANNSISSGMIADGAVNTVEALAGKTPAGTGSPSASPEKP
jgi:hypothetical protein